MIGVTIDHSALDKALDRYVHNLHELAQEGLRVATASAKASALLAIRSQTVRRTGSLQDDWLEVWDGPTLRRLSNYSGHARFIDSGTRAHVITATRAKFLRFQMNGETMFRRSVNHPGTKARPFVALALASGQMALRASLTQGVDKLAQGF